MKESNTRESTVIKVRFFNPVNNKTDYYFGSLKAIYTEFAQEQIGCSLLTLYSSRVTVSHYKVTDKCVISKHPIQRVKRAKK